MADAYFSFVLLCFVLKVATFNNAALVLRSPRSEFNGDDENPGLKFLLIVN